MSFHVDYDALDQLYSTLYGNVDAWNTRIVELSNKIGGLVSSANMTGTGADSVKTYLDSTHNTILPILSRLITAHINNCLLYVREYQSGIDKGLHAIIDETELETIKSLLSVQREISGDVYSDVKSALYSVSDIISVDCPGYETVDDNHKELSRLISKLLQAIRELEENHYSNDFIDTSELITTLTAFIKERLSDSRNYKTDFSIESLAASTTFLALYNAYVAVDAQVEASKSAVTTAIEEENNRIEALQAEIEEREKKATAQKWAVTGLCIIGSIAAIAAIVASGGTATPLVVGAVSAVSGTIIAGTNAAADQYVQYGKVNDWGNVGTSALLGGVSGFITGYVGAGVSSAISSSLSSAGSTLLNSSSMAVRVGSNAVIGATSEVVSGVASRGAVTFTTTMIYSGGDISTSVDAAWDAATDLKSIAFDATLGGIVGGIQGIKKPTSVQKVHREKIQDADLRTDAVVKDMQRGSGEAISRERADFIQESLQNYSDDSANIRSAYNNPNSPYKDQMDAVDDYVKGSPKWQGKTMRGINVSSDVADKLISGEEIDMLGPSSWSTDEAVAQRPHSVAQNVSAYGLHTVAYYAEALPVPDGESVPRTTIPDVVDACR